MFPNGNIYKEENNMFCKNCGAPVDDGAKFCKNCGGKVAEEVKVEEPVTEEVKVEPSVVTVTETVSSNPVKTKLEEILSGSMFLTFAILVSASTLFGLFVGSSNVIIRVLFTIFAWMAYAAAKKNTLKTSNIRNISGTFCAMKILVWVGVGCLGFVGILTLIFGSAVGASIVDAFNRVSGSSLNLVYAAYGSSALSVIIFVAILIAVALLIVMNLGYMTLHKFFKSLYQNLDAGVYSAENAKAASGWSLAFGIISGLGALGSLNSKNAFPAFVAAGSITAAWILLYIMIKKFAAAEDK